MSTLANYICNMRNSLHIHEPTIQELTGSVPGSEASKNDTCELGGAENPTREPENSFDVA